MKILFLSDIHLGSPLFNKEDELIALLEKDYDKVIVIGDIIDTWEDDTSLTLRNNSNILKVFRTLKDLVIIKGNHDPSMLLLGSVFPNAKVLDKYEDSFGTVVHGDEFDKVLLKHSWLAKTSWHIHAVLERVGLNVQSFLRCLLHSIAYHKDKKYYNDLVLDMEKEAVAKYKKVIMGHTHLPKLISEGDMLYVNCGDWVHNSSYVEFDGTTFSLKGDYHVV